MATKAKPAGRNRSAEARANGMFLRAFELTAEADAIIDRAAAHLETTQGRGTRAQAVEWLIRRGGKKIPAEK